MFRAFKPREVLKKFWSRKTANIVTPVHDPQLNLLLDQLYHEARLAPTDAFRQAALYRALNQARRFHDVKARVELQAFATSPEVTGLYEEACKQLGSSTRGRLGPLAWFALGLSGVGLWYYLEQPRGSKKKGGGMSGPLSLLTDNNHERIEDVEERFDDVKGADEAKDELMEIVDYLRDPDKYTSLGAKLPKGVLLVGPPGTGKTLLARAVAGEAGVPFFYCSGSAFDEMLVGVGPRRIRELFSEAQAAAPCIVFIDEIDSIGGKRRTNVLTKENTLNQLLTEIDGFKQYSGVILLAATNFPEALDPALIRPGRFDRQVTVPPPDLKGRVQLCDYYLARIVTDDSVDSQVLARATVGFTGADIANMCNQAALKAAGLGKESVTMADLESAIDDVLMGAKRKNQVEAASERRLTAYHEAGHALVAFFTPGSLPIHKATILNRGQALGMVSQLPETDMVSMSRQQMQARLAVAMAGRAAEELLVGRDHVTSGASSDFANATTLARAMVEKWGMGQHGFAHYTAELFEHVSPLTKQRLDEEVESLLTGAYEQAKAMLQGKEKQWHELAQALLTRETLSGDDIATLLK